ncbi:hypothetical protein JCM10212_002022 [Sporobolomyces blumeae]
MPIPALPAELLDLILADLAALAYPDCRADLSDCCLVSRAFLALARRHLYRDIEIRIDPLLKDDINENSFGEVLEGKFGYESCTARLVELLENNPSLANHVHTVYVNESEFYRTESQANAQSVSSLKATLDRVAPRARSLNLRGIEYLDVSELLDPRLEELEALYIAWTDIARLSKLRGLRLVGGMVGPERVETTRLQTLHLALHVKIDSFDAFSASFETITSLDVALSLREPGPRSPAEPGRTRNSRYD